MPFQLQLVFGGVLILYLCLIYWIGFRAAQKVESLDDFLLAGRRLPLSVSTLTLIATWYGAESLMTVANEVSGSGIRKALLDPIGIAICLGLAGTFVAGPLYRLNLVTIGDFFRVRYGPVSERIASWILVPSYFGWIAAQLLALATLLESVFQLPIVWGVLAIALIGSGYCMMGGMSSVSWIDMVQMIFIVLGLVVLTFAVVDHLGAGSLYLGIHRLGQEVPDGHWRLTTQGSEGRDLSTAMAAITIGAFGSLPVQDLMQRIMSSSSEKVARSSCFLAGIGYLLLGLSPIGIGMGASILMPEVHANGGDVLMSMSRALLQPVAMILFLLAVVSAVLSTFSSAVLSPAAIISLNILQPWSRPSRKESLEQPGLQSSLRLQRFCILAVVLVSVCLALMGESAYRLVLDSYALGMVALVVPFLGGLRGNPRSPRASIASMIAGVTTWSIHRLLGWEMLLEPWMASWLPLPQELVSVGASFLAYWLADQRLVSFSK